MKEKYKVGDRVLAKLPGGYFHAEILAIHHGWFWNTYYAKWKVVYEYDISYERIGKLMPWNIIGIN